MDFELMIQAQIEMDRLWDELFEAEANNPESQKVKKDGDTYTFDKDWVLKTAPKDTLHEEFHDMTGIELEDAAAWYKEHGSFDLGDYTYRGGK